MPVTVSFGRDDVGDGDADEHRGIAPTTLTIKEYPGGDMMLSPAPAVAGGAVERHREVHRRSEVAAGEDCFASSLSQVGKIEFELARDKVDHGYEVARGSIAASFGLRCLNEAVDSLE